MEKLKENLPYVLGGVVVGFGLAKALGDGKVAGGKGGCCAKKPTTKPSCCGGGGKSPADGPLSQSVPLDTDGVTVVLGVSCHRVHFPLACGCDVSKANHQNT
jgi:hypothetical protein